MFSILNIRRNFLFKLDKENKWNFDSWLVGDKMVGENLTSHKTKSLHTFFKNLLFYFKDQEKLPL